MLASAPQPARSLVNGTGNPDGLGVAWSAQRGKNLLEDRHHGPGVEDS